MKAVIIATGQAPRLLPLTKDTPISLLPIGGKTVLTHQIERLRAAGVDDILVVAGPHLDQMKAFGQVHGVDVRFNPFFLYSHVALTMWIIRHDLAEPFLLLYADVLFGEGVIERLLKQGGGICLAVKQGCTDAEAEIVMGESGLVHWIGKKPVTAEDEEVYGEFIGVARFDKSALPSLHAALDNLARENLGARFTHLMRTLIASNTQITGCEIEDRSWVDIDFPKDLDVAIRLFG